MANSGWALITGASSGIGEAFARRLAARGWSVVLVARSHEKLEALAHELMQRHQVKSQILSRDLSIVGAAQGVVQALEERGIEIELLVNNAGFGARGEFWKLPLDRQSEMLRLNIHALMELTYFLVPAMIAKRRGAIINVSSTAGFQPVPYTTVYGASKAFVTSFSLGLGEELGRYGVKVVTLCPGGTQTNFFAASQYGQKTLPGGLQPAVEVVDAALRKLDRGGGLVVPRFFNKASIFVQRFIPRSWVLKVSADLFRPPDLR